MGCGSSQTENSRFRHAYGEPSEFDTCSSVVSTFRDHRGEPDGREILPTSAPKEVLNDYSNRVSNFAPQERLGSVPRSKSASRSTNSKVVKSTASRSSSDFNEITEPEDTVVQDGPETAGPDETRSATTTVATAQQTAGDTGDFLTAS